LKGEKKMEKYATQELKEATEKLLGEKRERLAQFQELIRSVEGNTLANIKKTDNLRREILSLQEQLERLSAVENVEKVLNETHQYIPLVKDILGKFKGDLSIVIKLLVNAGIDIAKDLARLDTEELITRHYALRKQLGSFSKKLKADG